MDDIFIFAEETSKGWVQSKENRKDIVDRINNMVEDLCQDDEKYSEYMINDINDDNKIADGIDAFIGYFVDIEKH